MKGSKCHCQGVLVLLTGLWNLKDILNLCQNLSTNKLVSLQKLPASWYGLLFQSVEGFTLLCFEIEAQGNFEMAYCTLYASR